MTSNQINNERPHYEVRQVWNDGNEEIKIYELGEMGNEAQLLIKRRDFLNISLLATLGAITTALLTSCDPPKPPPPTSTPGPTSTPNLPSSTSTPVQYIPSGSGSICTCNKICTCVPVRKHCFVMFKGDRSVSSGLA